MKKNLVVFLVFLILGSTSAQYFTAEINPFPSEKTKTSSQPDTLRILAVMVSFQEDRDAATFGNGKFGTIYTQDYGNDIIDPLPHDRSYFESHLEFVKNYYQKVSGGIVTVEYTVLPDTFSVSQAMRNYSPAPRSDDFTPVGEFAKEVWTIADQMNPGFQFSDFDIFLIFHAGVGRDVTLPGSLGTERDIPSLYLGERGLKNIFGESFNGFPVSGGNFLINNSIIIPETESREVTGIGGSILFELSINGLLVASVASHIGLPDLFDTETGLSAIGRFGLMDGQSIFAYGGLFPPEPSPWEKIYLGWVQPVTVSPQDANILLASKLAASAQDTVILKIPINSSEYYLVENRNKDVNNDGAKLTYVLNGTAQTRTFVKDTTGFQSFDVDSMAGVVIDVDEFDWAVPGNGIVIWHIDDKIINEKIAENKINTDIENRGVDVEEADGIQDIGEQFQTIFGDVLIGEGEQADLWYSSNPSELYENIFSKNTRPNTQSNSGANSLITLKDFSDISAKMSFNLLFGDSLVKPIFSQNHPEFRNAAASINISTLTAQNFLFNIISANNLYIADESGNIVSNYINFSHYKTASLNWNNTNYVVGSYENIVSILLNDLTTTRLDTINLNEEITAPPVIVQNAPNQYQVLMGTASGKLVTISFGTFPSQLSQVLSIQQIAVEPIIKIASDGFYYSLITETSFFDNDGNQLSFGIEVDHSNKPSHFNRHNLLINKDKNGNYISFWYRNGSAVQIISNGSVINTIELMENNSFALGDLKNSGENFMIFGEAEKLIAKNIAGGIADNFPLTDQQLFSVTPLAADIEGDGASEIIASTNEGKIIAVDGKTGKLIPGFPISIGKKLSGTPVLFNIGGVPAFAAIDSAGQFNLWTIGSVLGNKFFTEENADNFNSSFVQAASQSNIVNEFFPSDKAYNYPNPVYDGETQIRYFVSENSKINIKIFDLAGDFVAELNDNALGGMDNETTWNVNDIQSGVYLARVEATSSSGQTEQNIIKIAVVK